MLYKKIIFIVIVLSNFFLFSCSLQHWTVGKKFNTENWKKFSSGKPVIIKDRLFQYEFKITKTKNVREYHLKGTMDGSKGAFKSIGNLVRRETSFYLILAKDNLVVKAISFFPSGTDIIQKLPFETTFQSDPFDSFIITGKVAARG